MDEIAPDVGNEGIVHEIRSERVTLVDGHSRGPREVSRDPSAALDGPADQAGDAPPRPDDPPRFVRTDPENRSGISINRDRYQWTGQLPAIVV